ncbi:MAG TPA: 50S ribosomal protein L11 methyltransferase [Methylomirabilota bacterium]|nr:50S ribosomal protein L11 methyltransferase [Methylomirabilota bacterium]
MNDEVLARMEWRQFVMNLEALPADAVEAVFARHGAQAITFSDAGDNPVLEPPPGETPLWHEVRITGLFAAAADLDSLRKDLLHSFVLPQLPEHRIETLPERIWEREWLRDFHPMRFGRRLWVSPRHLAVDADDAVVVRLDPGLAFGTGTHPTTALCLEWLDGLDLAGKRMLDFGCGSGILSIAALLLGAESVFAFDIDPQAITACRDNAAANLVGEQLQASLDPPSPDWRFDAVVANVLAAPLIRHAGTICEGLAAGGAIALSGITAEQADAVADAYRERVRFQAPIVRAPWAMLAGKRS